MATAHEDQKFGFALPDAAEAVRRVLKSEGLSLVGLHSHIGSQIFDTGGFEVAAHRVVRFLAALHREHGSAALTALATLDLGGGFGIAYRADETPLDVAQLAEELRAIVKRECHAADLDVPADRRGARPGDRRARHGHAVRGGHAQGRRPGRRRTGGATSASTAA